MADVSPSSRKVDEFLHSVSELSQERQKDDNKRQWELERDIDQLRSRSGSRSPFATSNTSGSVTTPAAHGIHNLTFDRSAKNRFRDKWKDKEPELPKRPSSDEQSPPKLPARKPEKDVVPDLPARPREESPPKLPQRPASANQNRVLIERDVDFGLAQPVARKQAPAIPEKIVTTEIKTRKGPLPTKPAAKESFTQMEKRIRESGVPDIKFPPEKPRGPKPSIIAPKDKADKPAEKLSEQAGSKVEKPAIGPKPAKKDINKPSEISKLANDSSHSSLPNSSVAENKPKVSGVSPNPTTKPTIKPKPSIPAKPSFKSYDAKDTEELKNMRSRLSPAKQITEKPRKVFDQDQKGLLESQIEKLGGIKKMAPPKPAKPAREDSSAGPEALDALVKLRPTKPSPAKPSAKPEAIAKIESLKARKNQSSEKSEPQDSSDDEKVKLNDKAEPPKKINFQDHLSTLLRPSTAPTLGLKLSSHAAPKPIKRALTISTALKPLSHPTKSRAKGPKRRLPKSIKSSSSEPLESSGQSTPSTSAKEKVFLEKDATGETTRIEDYKRPAKKTPPPIKAKKPDLKARAVSGELFI